MEAGVRAFFARYESLFNRSLHGEDAQDAMDETAGLYAPAFIAASPAGVMTGRNDDTFRQAMAQGHAHYRAIGTKDMRIRAIRFSPIDDHHCVAHVGWRATYTCAAQADVTIDFEVHYFVQMLDGEPKVFGWVSGDEQALLRAHGII
ncbi:MAG TPA: nuclear transport factor 2 family protein [Xanthobacteraceae bacterium]|nr:nuclear transport factor 2 family protein [Xanthobacteraceae bacterium]